MAIHMDEANEEFTFKMTFDYKDFNEFDEMMQQLVSLREEGSNVNPMMGMASEEDFDNLTIRHKLDKKHNVIRMPRTDLLKELMDDPEMGPEFRQDIDSIITLLKTKPDEERKDEDIKMFEMMLGGESKTIVHAPGKIVFTNDPNAIIEGNKVTFKTDVLKTLMEGKEPKFNDWIIKYK